MSHDDKLVRMANDIGKFFATQGEARAVEGIATHLRKFWTPRMRAEIIAHAETGGAGLDELPRQAVARLAAASSAAA